MQRTEGRAHAGGVDKVFRGEGDAMQQAKWLALHHRVFGLPGGGSRLISDEGDEAVQHRLQLLRAPQDCFGQLDGRDFLGSDLLAQHRSGQAAERVGHPSSPRAARLRISAVTPNVQGGILSQWFTLLVSVPSLGERMETRSPTMWVKPAPPGLRGSVGANRVPVISTMPSGYWCVWPIAWATSSVGSRLIFDRSLAPRRRNWSGPVTSSSTLAWRTSSSEKVWSNSRMKGPMAQEALLSLAWPSNRALRPSMSRKLTSLPRVAPTMRPRALTTSVTSGSGLFQSESERMPISAP